MATGIVLDFDGVLARSMELHAEAYRRVLEPFGVPASPRDVFLLEGARSETVLRELLARGGRELDRAGLRELAERKQRVFASLGPVSLYAGAEELVGSLRPRVDRLGLVTGTRRENVDRLVPHLLAAFDAVLAQDSYGRDKPDPEPYARAAAALGVPTASCAALENAPRGVESARRAGYAFVVGLATTVGPAELESAGSHAVAGTHAEAAQRLLEWVDRAATGGRGGSRT